jgi:FkbM family methyltransferase
MKTLIRKVLRLFLQFYPREHGKYTILQKLYFPYLAPTENEIEFVTMRRGFRMKLQPKELLQAHLYLFGTYELPVTNFLQHFLKTGDTVIDVGANIGYMTLFCSWCVGSSGKVYSFEPEQRNYEILQEHLHLNNVSNVTPLQYAATHKATELRLYLALGNDGAHSTFYNPDTLTQEFETIQGVPLDSLLDTFHLQSLQVVKIDVEGAEYEVIQGMAKLLTHFRPVLIVELNNEAQRGRGLSASEIKKRMLEQWNYQAFSLLENGCLTNNAAHKSFENAVFLHKEIVASFKHLIQS